MLKGYRTIIVNAVAVLFVIISTVFPDAELPTGEDAGALVDSADALIVAGLAFINMVLRAVTTTSIFNKDPV